VCFLQSVGCEFIAANKSVQATMPSLLPASPPRDSASGEDGTASAPLPVDVPPSEVSVSLCFLPDQPLDCVHPLVFSYYGTCLGCCRGCLGVMLFVLPPAGSDAAKLMVKTVTPASVPLAGKITVTLEGWEAVDRTQFAVRLQRPGDAPLTAV
jgi:hypothetical protein